MGDLTRNISKSEFACQCGCGVEIANYELVNVLQEMCFHFATKLGVQKVVFYINSGCRCVDHNKAEGGSSGSRHTYPHFDAADVRIKDVPADDIAEYLEIKYPVKYGIGRYNGRTHIDTRPTKARWDLR